MPDLIINLVSPEEFNPVLNVRKDMVNSVGGFIHLSESSRSFTNINTFFLLFHNLSPLMNTFSNGGLLAVQKTVSKSLSGHPPFVITTGYVAHTFKYAETNPFPRNRELTQIKCYRRDILSGCREIRCVIFGIIERRHEYGWKFEAGLFGRNPATRYTVGTVGPINRANCSRSSRS